jgi:hypothetical protein
MTFFALNNPQPDKPSPGSITLYCLKDWAGTMYLPEGELPTRPASCSVTRDGRASDLGLLTAAVPHHDTMTGLLTAAPAAAATAQLAAGVAVYLHGNTAAAVEQVT